MRYSFASPKLTLSYVDNLSLQVRQPSIHQSHTSLHTKDRKPFLSCHVCIERIVKTALFSNSSILSYIPHTEIRLSTSNHTSHTHTTSFSATLASSTQCHHPWLNGSVFDLSSQQMLVLSFLPSLHLLSS